MTKTEKIFFSLIVLLPIIDIITSFTTSLPLSFGALLRTGFMFFLFIFIVNYLRPTVNTLFLFSLPFLSITLTFLINFVLKQPFYITEEIQFVVKTAYFVVMIFSAFVFLEKRLVKKDVILQGTAIASIIVGASYWIAILTKTDITSYTYVKAGYSGWFYSANELSVIVIILLTLAIIHFHASRSALSLVAFSFILTMTPMIGTKTAFYGAIIIILSYIVLIIFMKQIKQNLPLLAITVFSIFFLPLTPYMTNMTSVDSPVEKTKNTEQEMKQQLMSSRDIYLGEKKADYLQAPLIRKLFGLGYAGDYKKNPKMIEMDFFDLFFSYGVVGTFIILLPLPVLLNKLLIYRCTISYFLLLLTLALIGGIAFVAGHVMFAPAVMTYVAILVIIIGLEARKTA
ncbi:O-antigen ligase family protein [Pseudogracilibacillus sp. SO30301A]|uniref:O-antigen ligase family protein n=1 Tax=Pseudogracilibacillus sp. SO30301A TaxID=3098291 RepID=UPI00300DEF02